MYGKVHTLDNHQKSFSSVDRIFRQLQSLDTARDIGQKQLLNYRHLSTLVPAHSAYTPIPAHLLY
eukprot:6187549-Pleurochrysis_carterae.AAC.2